jgi:hypothetical protein
MRLGAVNLVSILAFTGMFTLTVLATVCRAWTVDLRPVASPNGSGVCRPCPGCFKPIFFNSNPHTRQDCIRLCDPRRGLYKYLNFTVGCVAGGYAATLITELWWPGTHRTLKARLEDIGKRDLDYFLYPLRGGTESQHLRYFNEKCRALQARLRAGGEFVSCTIHKPGHRAVIRTFTFGMIDFVFQGKPRRNVREPSWSSQPMDIPRRHMRLVVDAFDFHACRVAFVIRRGQYHVYDGDLGAPVLMCCYCDGRFLFARLAKYRNRGHSFTLASHVAVNSHYVCMYCENGGWYHEDGSARPGPVAGSFPHVTRRPHVHPTQYYGAYGNQLLPPARDVVIVSPTEAPFADKLGCGTHFSSLRDELAARSCQHGRCLPLPVSPPEVVHSDPYQHFVSTPPSPLFSTGTTGVLPNSYLQFVPACKGSSGCCWHSYRREVCRTASCVPGWDGGSLQATGAVRRRSRMDLLEAPGQLTPAERANLLRYPSGYGRFGHVGLLGL